MPYWSKKPKPIPWYRRRVKKSNINDYIIMTTVQQVLDTRKWEDRLSLTQLGAPGLFGVLIRSTINTYMNLHQLSLAVGAALHTARPVLLRDRTLQDRTAMFVRDVLTKLA